MVFVDVVVAAIAVGLLLGGRLGALAEIEIHGAWLGFAAIALQIAAFPSGVLPWQTPGSVARALWLCSYALLIVLLCRNARLRGAPIVALGIAGNLAAILANGGLMPVRAAALAAAHRDYHVHDNSIELARPHLGLLVDRWAVPGWVPLGNVYSIGDMLIAVGISVVLIAAMRPMTGKRWHTPA
jgi:Family of unknown function (DUF5317)